MPTHTTSEASTASDPVVSVRRAIRPIRPVVAMWRDGLTVIALGSGPAEPGAGLPDLRPGSGRWRLRGRGGAAAGRAAVDATTKTAPVLVLGGDTIIGGAQNRIIHIDILLAAAAKTAIPVS